MHVCDCIQLIKLSVIVISQVTLHVTFCFCRHKLPHFTSQDVRRAVINAVQKLPEPQWETVQLYLDHGARLVGSQDAVDAAVLLDSLSV